MLKLPIAFSIFVATSGLVQAGPLSGSQVLKRSQAAYDAVSSLEETVRGDIGGSGADAHISFVRPGKLRVTGKSMFGAPYELLVTGGKTWVFNGGSWSTAQSPEMGIATITGISANTGTHVPAALLHASFGGLKSMQASPTTVKLVNVRGHSLYRVSATQPFSTSLWIDAKTFFLVKSEMVAMGKTISLTFDPPVVNKPIPARRFVK